MDGSKKPVRLKVLYGHTGGPSHLVWSVKPKGILIHTRCGLLYSTNFIGRGKIRIINLRTNRLSCTRCQAVAEQVVNDSDNYHQGGLYEE